jgi:Leucine-rich repeat (LRR) protein
LDLARNNLVGAIPSGLFLLKNLSHVYLYHNRLSGEIPRLVESTNLIHIDLSMNNLTGSISKDFGKLQNLKLLYLFTNQLIGEILTSLAQLSRLIDFKVFSNKLAGTLPSKLTHTASNILAALHSAVFDDDVPERGRKKNIGLRK